MPKPLFTPENVNDYTDTLYSKSDTEVLAQADAVATNFSTWLEDNFDLSSEQSAYLATYPDKVNKFYGHLFAAGFLSHSPIFVGATPVNPAPRRAKETRANLFGDIKFDDTSQTLTGSIEMKISFKLL